MSRHSTAPLDWIDPRSRVLAAVGYALVVALSNGTWTLSAALLSSLGTASLCGLPLRSVVRRLTPLNTFMLLLLAVLPLTVPGRPLAELGPCDYSQEGLRLAMTIVIKGNAIVLMLVGLVGALPMNTLGHALSHLYVPDKLAHLLLFTVRYLEVLRREYQRLGAAMRLRGFRPRFDWHTYRSYSHLIGMLLVRSLDRSERVVDAMKCRGFRGHFYLLDHFHYSQWDLLFGSLATAVLAGLAVLEWR